MTIDEAKRVRIVDFLAQLGHRAQYMKSEQYWYLSPLRKEVTPSFKVNDRLNEWYDFGEATGGDLVELGKYLCGTKSVSEALAYIKRYVNGVSLPRTRALPATSRPVEADMKNLIIVPLRHHALLSYLHSRMIDSDIGRMFCKEVHYELRQRRYFALAFGNISGGYDRLHHAVLACVHFDIDLERGNDYENRGDSVADVQHVQHHRHHEVVHRCQCVCTPTVVYAATFGECRIRDKAQCT